MTSFGRTFLRLQWGPVGFPQGGGFFISMPLKVCNVVTVVFAQRSIDTWAA